MTINALVDLDNIAAGIGGFKIQGEMEFDAAGSSVSAAGDVNGDGLADLLVGARQNSGGGLAAGAAYVVFGKSSGTLVDLEQVAQGNGGFKFQGGPNQDHAGSSVSAAGDVNGDGRTDFLIGANYESSGGDAAGAAYVVFGKGGTSLIDLGQVAQGNGGFKIQGETAYDFAGRAVAGAGDVNGDGKPDLLVGSPGNGGAAYLVFGKNDGTLVDLDQVAQGTGGFKIQRVNGFDRAGVSVSAAGDVNGDGKADLLVGANRNESGGDDAGAAYLVLGKSSGTLVDLDQVAQGIGGFKIQGETSYDEAGSSVSAAGDVNGDGKADFLIGAPGNSSGANFAGATYVVFGNNNDTLVDLDQIALGNGGFKIQGETSYDAAGFSVSAAGDVNGDGKADLLVGAFLNESGGDYAGAAYLVFGKSDGKLVDLAQVAQGKGGFELQGETGGDQAGYSVSAAGDVNGDGRADLLVAGWQNGSYGTGAAYVIFGPPPNKAPAADSDSARTAYQTPVVIDVLDGDSDLEGQLDRTSVVIAGQGTKGTAVFDPQTQKVTYTPGHGKTGADSFTYTVEDQDDAVSNSATVTVEIDLRTIIGNDLPNFLQGSAISERIEGKGGLDIIRGEGGDDVLVGGPGFDLLDGGAGIDTAIFKGLIKDFAGVRKGSVLVTDLKPSDGFEGADSLTKMELLRFDDALFDLRTGQTASGPATASLTRTAQLDNLLTLPDIVTD